MNEVVPWETDLPGGGTLSGIRHQAPGIPLLLIHGLFDSAESWRPFMEIYPGPSLAVDVPGFQGSSRALRPEISSFAEQISLALDQAGIQSCRLAGHSLGGAISSVLASDQPERFTDLTLIAPAGYGHIPMAKFFDLPIVSNVSESVLRGALRNPALVKYTYTRAVAGGHPPDAGLLRRIIGVSPFISSGVRDAVHALSHAGSRRGLGLEENFYRGPVICVWGDDDRLIPRSHIRNVRRLLPQADIRVWMDVSHHPQAEDPTRMGRLLLENMPDRPAGEKAEILPARAESLVKRVRSRISGAPGPATQE